MMKTILIYAGLALLCISSAIAEQPDNFPIDKKGVSGISEFENRWYSKALDRLEERALMLAKTNRTKLFRFILLPTWGNPISVRLSIAEGVARIEGKRLDGLGGYDPGKLVEKTSTTLRETEVKEFIALYDRMGFFTLNTADKMLGKDGSQWILEAADEGKYHVVVRWSPTEYDPDKRQTANFVNACKWLYKKAQFKEDAKNKGVIEIEKQ